MAGSNENGWQLPNAPDERPTRGACRMVQTNRIVRLTQSRIKVILDPKHGSATSKSIHSLLAHDVGAIICQHCAMDDGYWTKMSEDKKKDLISEITDEMIAKRDDYIKELAQAYPEDTPSKEIIVTDKDAGLKIVTNVLGVKLGKDICGLGAGRVRELKGSSMRIRQLEEELAAEKVAKEEAQQSLAVFMQRMERWEQTMQQLAQQVPGLIIPPPMIVPPQTNSDQQVGEEEEENFSA